MLLAQILDELDEESDLLERLNRLDAASPADHSDDAFDEGENGNLRVDGIADHTQLEHPAARNKAGSSDAAAAMHEDRNTA